MATIGFIEGDDPTDVLYVGAKDDANDYRGPVAQVTFDKTWLYISTDDHEGNAMLNIEALPYLQDALAKIAAQIADETQAGQDYFNPASPPETSSAPRLVPQPPRD